MILQTERLYLREMTQEDLPALAAILQDEETMYAYNGAFTAAETQEWLEKQLGRYRRDGVGLWAAVRKDTDEMIGQCGLMVQTWKDREIMEVSYLFRRDCWHQGYASEAARACKEYAFHQLGVQQVCSVIRDINVPSQRVAVRNGMRVIDSCIKHYKGVDMPHDLYAVSKK